MVSQRGIEVNISKITTIQKLKSSSTIKGVQRLSGHIAALNHFLPKSGKSSLPF